MEQNGSRAINFIFSYIIGALRDMAIKVKFVLFEINFTVIYEDPLQCFRTLLGFRNILTKNSMQSAILVL